MNEEQMKTFISVAENQSFSAAARERFISQPTISNQMRQLEEELEVTLFEKSKRPIILTMEGQIFLSYAKQMLEMKEKCRNALCGKKDNAQTIIDIGAPHLQTDNQLSEFSSSAAELLSGTGKVTRIVDYGEGLDLPQKVADGLLDFAVTNVFCEHEKLEFIPAFTEEICFITPNISAYRGMSRRQVKDCMVNDDHIRFDFGRGSDYLWNNFFGKTLGVDLHDIKTRARASNYHIVMRMVEKNLGVAFASTVLLRKALKEKRILAYRCRSLLEKDFWICYQKEKVESSELLIKVRDLLVEEMRYSVPDLEDYQNEL